MKRGRKGKEGRLTQRRKRRMDGMNEQFYFLKKTLILLNFTDQFKFQAVETFE